MSPPGESLPNDRKRKTNGYEGKPPAKRCVRPAPVLVPTSARPVPLAPIAPAVVPSTGSHPVPLAPACAPSLALTTVHQQHNFQPPAGFVYTTPQQSLPTPQIFMQSKLRSGKWSSAEEEYCGLLIDIFDKGLAVECENGSTLRSYLAKKLHCSPMRISKKFAGTQLGKKVFLAKGETNTIQTASKAAIAKLRVAEAKFYNSLFPGSNLRMDGMPAFFPSLVSFPTFPANPNFPAAPINGMAAYPVILNSPPQNSLVTGAAVPMKPPGHGQTNGQTGGILIPLSANAAQISAPIVVPPEPNVALAETHVDLPVPGQSNAPNITVECAIAPIATRAGTVSSNDPNDSHTAKLHESYLKALKEMEGRPSCSQKPEITANSGDTNSTGPTAGVINNEAVRFVAKPNNFSATWNTSKLGKESRTSYPDRPHGHGMNESAITKTITTTVLSAEIMHTAAKQMNVQRACLSGPPPAVGASPLSETPETSESTTSDTKELPDLLAGFEKASRTGALHSQANLSCTMAHGIGYQHSPPFTSRSFDDLHCFLGKVSPLHETEEVAKKGVSTTTGSEGGKSHGQDGGLSVFTEAAASQPHNSSAAQPWPHSTTIDTGLADPYQEMSAAANEHSAFVPTMNMFDVTNEQHLFFSDLNGALKPTGFGGAEGSSGENGTRSQLSPAVAPWISSNRDASVVSGSERSDYCSSVNENESLG